MGLEDMPQLLHAGVKGDALRQAHARERNAVILNLILYALSPPLSSFAPCRTFQARACKSKMVYHVSEFFFNINDGYPEGLCRGFRSGILTAGDYSNLTQCETLEGMCMG